MRIAIHLVQVEVVEVEVVVEVVEAGENYYIF
jgi:hypothetical protein